MRRITGTEAIEQIISAMPEADMIEIVRRFLQTEPNNWLEERLKDYGFNTVIIEED